jgi:hypothetical protein
MWDERFLGSCPSAAIVISIAVSVYLDFKAVYRTPLLGAKVKGKVVPVLN